ncbi:MAG: ABC transporter ATP-binding protein [candidate division WS1 bacterium]|jgi:subfamily B ATP-binding cassette protein MsbA|nr:ABC transporter ATP-binding protein [candidate division WS1 bacterium]
MDLFLRLLQFAARYRAGLIFAIFLVFVTTGLGMVPPYFTRLLVDSQLSNYHALEPAAQQSLQTELWALVLAVCGGLMGLRLAIAIVSYVRSMIMVVIGNRVVFDIRQQLYRHLQRLSMRYFETRSTGRIMTRILYDVQAIQQTLTGNLVDIITNSATVVFVIVLIFWINWRLGLIAIGILPLYVFNFLAWRPVIRTASTEAREQFSEISGRLNDAISGIRVIKAFTRERSEARRFVHEVREIIELNVKAGRARTWLSVISTFVTGVASVIVIYVGGREILFAGRMSYGELIQFNAYLTMLYSPIIQLVTINEQIQVAMAAIERIFELFDTAPDIQERRVPVILHRCVGEVEFDHVYFSYDPNEDVLQDICLTSQPGTVTALVGRSGSGKSTLINLIPRFYDPTRGRVLLDGVDLRDLQITNLRKQIGMVMQDSFLFAGTLRDNIKYGRPDATDAEVVQAAIAANAHDFVTEFTDGYESRVGERGTRLSGGQRQRISIARAILRNPRILILDEATSALDSESEAAIQDALEHLMQGRTTFTIAHRLSTVMNADEIIVLDYGKIVERGTHAELATAGGIYEMLCEVQFKQAVEKMEEHEDALRAQQDDGRRKRDSGGERSEDGGDDN